MPLWSPTNKWIEMGVQASSTPTTTKRKDTQRERNCKGILSTLIFLGLASRPASYSGGLHFPLCVCLVASQVTKQESDHSSVPESFLLFNFHLHPSSSSSSSYPSFFPFHDHFIHGLQAAVLPNVPPATQNQSRSRPKTRTKWISHREGAQYFQWHFMEA